MINTIDRLKLNELFSLFLIAVLKNQFCEKIVMDHLRAVFYIFNCGLPQQHCIDRFHFAFGNKAPSKATVYDWFVELESGRVSLNNEFRRDRPKTAIVSENIDAIREMIETNRYTTTVK